MLRVAYASLTLEDTVLAGPLSPPTPTREAADRHAPTIYLASASAYLPVAHEATAATVPPAAASPSSQA